MVNDSPAVWVTGMAWTTGLGAGLKTVWEALLAGASAIDHVPTEHDLRSDLAVALPHLPLDMPLAERQHTLTCSTLKMALNDAGIAADAPQLMSVLGTSYAHHLDDTDTESLSGWANAAARSLGFKRPPVVVSTACSAGADAIQVGLSLIRDGAADLCICGGADILSEGKRLGHSRLGTLSPDGLYAFDRSHSGTVLGEGAAFIVLESKAHAQARGAQPYGFIVGAGAANDAVNAVAPDPSGQNVINTVERALLSAGLHHDDIALINAHGTGTQINDNVESIAYSSLFACNAHPPVLFATKGALGHTLGATGAIEAIVVLLALNHHCAPPVYALQQPLDVLKLPIPIHTPMVVGKGYGISVTLGFGGFDTCLVLQGAQRSLS